jgi:hypothetical protein
LTKDHCCVESTKDAFEKALHQAKVEGVTALVVARAVYSQGGGVKKLSLVRTKPSTILFGKRKPSTRFRLPTDFPLQIYDKTGVILFKYIDTDLIKWRSFWLGWDGLKNRYRAMSEYDEEFTQSIKKHGNSPLSPEERYKQDKALFGFFTSSVSAVECFFYAAYWMGAFLKPKEFPSDSESLRLINPQCVVRMFETHFPGDTLTGQMAKCVSDSSYGEMKDMRDVLSHRGVLPRRFTHDGDNVIATVPVNPKAPIEQWRHDLSISIDEKTTAIRRRWLSDTLRGLMTAAAGFCENTMIVKNRS